MKPIVLVRPSTIVNAESNEKYRFLISGIDALKVHFAFNFKCFVNNSVRYEYIIHYSEWAHCTTKKFFTNFYSVMKINNVLYEV